MPPPDFAAFQADPTALLTWLERNLLLSGTTANVINPPGTASMRMVAAPAIPAANRSGVPIDVFRLHSDGGPADLPAFVCNYTANNSHSVTLSAAAQFCFTVTLNGCTFGVAAPDALGHVQVTHANAGGNTTNQRAQIQAAHGVGADMAGVTLFEPALYRRFAPGKNMNATVFGIRVGMNWRFYFQAYESAAPNAALQNSAAPPSFLLHGVFPI